MHTVRRALFAIVLAACAARPTSTNHFDLAAQTIANPRDVPAHLALAAADELGRPSEALGELEIVVNLGGPLGIRWTAADRARLVRLYVARARVRLARGAATARDDLDKARSFGAQVDPADDTAATEALAMSELRHVDAGVRAQGRAHLARVEKLPPPGPFGMWLWSIGARREAYEQLFAWHQTAVDSDPALSRAFELASAWWTSAPGPVDVPPPWVPTVEPVALDDAPLIAAARYASARFPGAPDTALLVEIARAYVKEPAVADRLARDVIAGGVDAAAGQATVGALFDALGDPARARAAWQAASAASPEPHFVRGLAESAARAGDAAAATVFATQAAAAWGDPAVVWIAVGNALEQHGSYVEALTCARSAIDLAGPDQRLHAFDLAIAASRALGRTAQADTMLFERGELAHPSTDPTNPDAALLAYQELPTAGTIARMWVASRAHPNALELRVTLYTTLSEEDPRRPALAAELVGFAADPDPERALAAVQALSARGR
jgi:tetratricopeptide (TPR) repeat protein